MNDLVKIIGVGFIGGMLALTIRKERPEFALLTVLITSLVILGSVVNSVGDVIAELRILVEKCGVDVKYFVICIKAVGMAYISQFAAEILRDSGENSIASKVEVMGKVSILVLTMPVMTSFLQLCIKVVNGV